MNHNQQPVGIRPDAGHKTPEQAAEGQKTVTMEFPNLVILTLGAMDSIHYPAGVHQVPEHLADHWYLKALGAHLATAAK